MRSEPFHTMSRLARGLASAGFAVLRFDFTGGESGGDATSLCAREAPIYTRLISNLERRPTATVPAECRPVAQQPVHEVLTASAVDLDWKAGDRFGVVHGFDGPLLKAPPLPPGRLRPR